MKKLVNVTGIFRERRHLQQWVETNPLVKATSQRRLTFHHISRQTLLGAVHGWDSDKDTHMDGNPEVSLDGDRHINEDNDLWSAMNPELEREEVIS